MSEPFTLTLAGQPVFSSARHSLAAFGGQFVGGMASPHPRLWFLGSLLLRMSIALAGFYFVSGGQWKRLLPCLFGFVVSRPVVTWLTRPSRKNQSRPTKEARHAS